MTIPLERPKSLRFREDMAFFTVVVAVADLCIFIFYHIKCVTAWVDGRC